jgi:hypothetical protein
METTMVDEPKETEASRISSGLFIAQHLADVVHGPQPAAHAQGNENLRGGLFHDGVQAVAVVQAGHGILEEEFVRALLIVVLGEILGFPENSQPLEMNTFHKVGTLDVKAWNDAVFHGRLAYQAVQPPSTSRFWPVT